MGVAQGKGHAAGALEDRQTVRVRWKVRKVNTRCAERPGPLYEGEGKTGWVAMENRAQMHQQAAAGT